MARWSEGKRRMADFALRVFQVIIISPQSMSALVPRVNPEGSNGGTGSSVTRNSMTPLTPPSPVGTCILPKIFAVPPRPPAVAVSVLTHCTARPKRASAFSSKASAWVPIIPVCAPVSTRASKASSATPMKIERGKTRLR